MGNAVIVVLRTRPGRGAGAAGGAARARRGESAPFGDRTALERRPDTVGSRVFPLSLCGPSS
ncbi:hypothetical protein CBM2606_A50016 [Cupriavidus taiwanensis]|nr:hypothetical protein CBM2606_A50016 [Cupriavidus taiwanensis]